MGPVYQTGIAIAINTYTHIQNMHINMPIYMLFIYIHTCTFITTFNWCWTLKMIYYFEIWVSIFLHKAVF